MMSFVLGATAHGPMIFSRLDYAKATLPDGKEGMYGVGAQLMERGAYDAQEVGLLKQLLSLRHTHFGDGALMLDCGANVGVITLECAKHMAGWGRVIAFEPQERLYYALCGNIALQNVWNAKALYAAVGKASGAMSISEPNYLRPGSYGSYELRPGSKEDVGQEIDRTKPTNMVEVKKIDSFGFDRVDLMKIDVEGMECDVIDGAWQTIKRCEPIIIVEHTKTDRPRLVEMLKELGYRMVHWGINALAVPKHAQYVVDRVAGDAYDMHASADMERQHQRAIDLAEKGNAEEALRLIDEVVAAEPDNMMARVNRGTSLMQMLRVEEALEVYQDVIDRGAQDLADRVKFGRAFGNLLLGKLKEGFVDFERRKKNQLPEIFSTFPEWKYGIDLNGLTILVVSEMGYGDNVMFSRYFKRMAESGANVMVTLPPSMESLFRTIPWVQVYGTHSPKFDCWVRIMSLAYMFGTDVDTVPPPTEFQLPSDQIAKWRFHLNSCCATPDRLKIGLVWSGSRDSQYDVHRNIPFEKLRPLLALPGIEWFSLQMDIRDSDKDAFEKSEVWNCGRHITNFLDTACILKNLDAMVTVDTSICHVAGTVGIPTLVMLTSFRTYWLWIRGRSDSPWYPTAKCFRQIKDGEWEPVVEMVKDDLVCRFPSILTAGRATLPAA